MTSSTPIPGKILFGPKPPLYPCGFLGFEHHADVEDPFARSNTPSFLEVVGTTGRSQSL